ncbi:glycosyltransferase family 4 protein [Exiguobacterium sp. s157]|uniref:glycosyltransferase family 4 protein n=1 Tax=Exiguobacterium sp. s157 TaxID=2751233 RepID=UPI001BE76452|nr:glycosyltransferase family 4 protein [Exiguobacterium sp. s157]
MKILVVCQYYYPEPFRISDICEALVSKGHKVTVLTGLPNYPEGKVLNDYRFGRNRKEIIRGVNVIRSFEIGRGKHKINLFLNYLSFSISASLKALLMKDEFDVVFVNQLSPVTMAIPALVYKKRYKKKILLYCLDLWPASLVAGGVKEGSTIYAIFKKISKWIYESSDYITVTSNMFKDYFEHTLNIRTKHIHHLPQYAEELFSQKLKHENNGNNNFVFAGNIGEIQSVETIIKAANHLKNRKDIFFHIVGDGSRLEECKRITSDLKLNNIKFYGRRPVSEMPKLYALADAMLLTLKDNQNLSYTLPGKVQSYMAAGKPILCAINGEAKKVITDAECGLVCQAEDYKSLADLIADFCDKADREQLAINSYRYYTDNYSKDQFIKRLEDILLNLGDK